MRDQGVLSQAHVRRLLRSCVNHSEKNALTAAASLKQKTRNKTRAQTAKHSSNSPQAQWQKPSTPKPLNLFSPTRRPRQSSDQSNEKQKEREIFESSKLIGLALEVSAAQRTQKPDSPEQPLCLPCGRCISVVCPQESQCQLASPAAGIPRRSC